MPICIIAGALSIINNDERMFIVYCMVSLLSKVKKHVKFVVPTVTCDMEKQVWMIEAQKLKVISKIL